MRQQSDSMAHREKLYKKAKREYMAAHPRCEACPVITFDPPAPSTDLHHKRGRAGTLLYDKRFFMAGCRTCHDWIHDNPAKARELGLLAPPNEWNVPPRD